MILYKKVAVAMAVVGFAAIIGGKAPAEAASMQPLASIASQIAAEGSVIQKTTYGYCRRWRVRCGKRWGWSSPRFYRCMRRHDCARPARPYRRAVRWRCAKRWGWNTRRFYRCVRRHS